MFSVMSSEDFSFPTALRREQTQLIAGENDDAGRATGMW
jgi:hypothetical protein